MNENELKCNWERIGKKRTRSNKGPRNRLVYFIHTYCTITLYVKFSLAWTNRTTSGKGPWLCLLFSIHFSHHELLCLVSLQVIKFPIKIDFLELSVSALATAAILCCPFCHNTPSKAHLSVDTSRIYLI